MHRRQTWRTAPLVIALALLAANPAGLVAQIEAFTLTKAIPADACLVVHARGHEGQAFLDEQYQRIWKAVEKARFDQEVYRLLKKAAEVGGKDMETFESNWQRIMDLKAGVDWSTLWQREFAYAHKHGPPSFYDGLLLMRPPPDKVKEDFEGLAAILKAIAELGPEALVLTEDDQGDTAIRKLAFTQAAVPMSVTLARHEDVLIVGLFGSAMAEQSLALLRGYPGTTLASTPRFQAAFKNLPPGKDSIFFFDIAKQLDQVRSIFRSVKAAIEGAAGPAPADTQPAPPHPTLQWIGLLGKLLDTIDMFEYVAEVATTDGMKTTATSVTVLRADAETRPYYPAFFGTGTLSDPLKYVPKDAKDMSVRTGIDWLALYKEIVRFFSQEVPGGAERIAVWNALQEGWGLNVEQDLLGWLQGGLCTFTVPGPGRYSTPETVFMLKVRDVEKAREMVNRALDGLQPHLAQQGGAVSDAAVAGAEGFRSLSHPLVIMMGWQPTIGVDNGWLFIGSSPKGIARAIKVATGEAPSFAENEQFQRDGLRPAENVIRLSFSDLRDMGKELGQALQMLPAMIRFADASGGGQLSKQPGVDAMLRVLAKVGRVAPEFNFLQSSCTQSTFDGHTIATETVTTYCEPPPPPAPPATRPAPKEEEPPTPPPGEPEG
jgi:hypothetical protein